VLILAAMAVMLMVAAVDIIIDFHLTAFIRYRNSHVWISSLFKPPFPPQKAADI
jgi:hypothetical protein